LDKEIEKVKQEYEEKRKRKDQKRKEKEKDDKDKEKNKDKDEKERQQEEDKKDEQERDAKVIFSSTTSLQKYVEFSTDLHRSKLLKRTTLCRKNCHAYILYTSKSICFLSPSNNSLGNLFSYANQQFSVAYLQTFSYSQNHFRWGPKSGDLSEPHWRNESYLVAIMPALTSLYHRAFYQQRLDRIRNAEVAKRNRERIKNPSTFPTVPSGDP
jgi:hypothetical protein